MAFKSITTIVTDVARDAHAIDAAADLTRRQDGHLDVLCLGLDRTQPGFYYAGTNALITQDNLDHARSEAEEIETAINERLRAAGITFAATPLCAQMVGLTPFLAHHTRFSDVVVLSKPYGEGRGHEHEEILEAALFNAHVPVMVVPEGVDTIPSEPNRVVVAWNESHEAMTAIRAALPVLQTAACVDIVIVDPPKHSPDRSDPGGQLSQMLARHGVRAEVSVLAKTMPRVSDVLCRHVRDKNADMVVMGAYGHSRFRESLLGGATRNMLEMAEVPVLMAH